MSITRTYTVGAAAGVHRLDNLTGLWTNVSITGSFPLASTFTLTDVETDPTNPDKVFVVGAGNAPDALYGIYVSLDAGANWFIPGGTYQTNLDVGNTLNWNEVFVLDSSNIMVAGRNGYVAFSTDGGLTFNLSTQIAAQIPCPACPPIIPNVFSLHFISPTVGVVGLLHWTALTINGGLTWSILNSGTVITGLPSGIMDTAVGIHLSSDQQVINALAQNAIYRSIDGGTTWNEVYTFTNNSGRHLTWINDQELWGFGNGGERTNSIDGGATWNIINAWSPAGPGQFAGHFYAGQNGFYSENFDILSTNNGSLSGIVSENAGFRIFAVWTGYVNTVCYELLACEQGISSILVDNDLSNYIGQTIQVCPSDLPPAGGSGMGNGLPIIPNPQDPGITRYSLVDCCGLLPSVIVLNNLAPYSSGGVVVIPSLSLTTCWKVEKGTGGPTLGLVDLSGGTYFNDCPSCLLDYPCSPIPVLTECTCFTITQSAGCQGAISLLNIGIIYDDCPTCITKCYFLVDCINPNNFLVVSNDFAQYVGQIIKLEDCPDTCWIVSVSDNCDNSVCVSDVISTFTTCVECLPPAPPPTPFELHPRKVKPGYDTPGCSPEYTENVNCNFAEQSYNTMLIDRYGLTICCEPDRIKWDIKKQLLDFKTIYDPSLCKCFLQTCCPPTCTEAILQVFNPTTCPAPTNTVAVIVPVPIPCPAPTQTSAVINPLLPICRCYQILMVAGDCTIDYADCDLVSQTIDISGTTSIYICSTIVPTPAFGCSAIGLSILPSTGTCILGNCVQIG